MRQRIEAFIALFLKMLAFAVCVGALTRVVLLFNTERADLDFTFNEWCRVFLLGAVNDLCVMTLGFVVMALFIATVSERKYDRPAGYILLGLLAAALLYVTCCNTIFDEYGSAAPAVATGILAFWCGSFALRLFVPRIRRPWTRCWFAILAGAYVGAMLLNAACEVVFWREFGVRYNFIAVDYLVYTHEVLGNIVESYPVGWMMAGLLVVTALLTRWGFRRNIAEAPDFVRLDWKCVVMPCYLLLAGGALLLLPFNERFQNRPNVYVNELQANGAYKFCNAFIQNELDYRQFYLTLPDDEAAALLAEAYGSSGPANRHAVAGDDEERHLNIVLISLESMSADYLARYGNTGELTPHLDALCSESLVFDNLFATGNRTVRGLEALTLSLPPCPGQSIVKRPDNGGRFTTATVLRDKGYSTTYFYGGNAYFDNMESFFGGNGYAIVDQKCYTPEEIHFANIWGVCDEDAYAKAIRVINERQQAAGEGHPFFAHIMSVSNHRPFTYPEGRISIPADAKSRAGGVMYSDYALGQFLEQARQQPWFDDTVFVITADHCASSAGKTEIPLEKYHIPALFYAPKWIEPGCVAKFASQIDLMPTLFALLGLSYDSYFYGQNILDEQFRERAFIATYQDLGYLDGDIFTVLSPVRRVEQYRLTPEAGGGNPYAVRPLEQPDETMLRRAIAFYQCSSSAADE